MSVAASSSTSYGSSSNQIGSITDLADLVTCNELLNTTFRRLDRDLLDLKMRVIEINNSLNGSTGGKFCFLTSNSTPLPFQFPQSLLEYNFRPESPIPILVPTLVPTLATALIAHPKIPHRASTDQTAASAAQHRPPSLAGVSTSPQPNCPQENSPQPPQNQNHRQPAYVIFPKKFRTSSSIDFRPGSCPIILPNIETEFERNFRLTSEKVIQLTKRSDQIFNRIKYTAIFCIQYLRSMRYKSESTFKKINCALNPGSENSPLADNIIAIQAYANKTKVAFMGLEKGSAKSDGKATFWYVYPGETHSNREALRTFPNSEGDVITTENPLDNSLTAIIVDQQRIAQLQSIPSLFPKEPFQDSFARELTALGNLRELAGVNRRLLPDFEDVSEDVIDPPDLPSQREDSCGRELSEIEAARAMLPPSPYPALHVDTRHLDS